MKRLLLSFIILCSTSILFSQVPQGIKYQAVVRDISGHTIKGQNISVKVLLVDSTLGGNVVYSEVHKIGTNQFGLFSISIGRGIQSTGNFSNINWSTGNKWLRLELDITGGTNYVLFSTSELLAVPYALYAESTNPTTGNDFNPLYPDGTSGMIAVNKLITDQDYYVVPAGKNFHVTSFVAESTAPYNEINAVVNDISFVGYSGQAFLIYGPGDTISKSSSIPILAVVCSPAQGHATTDHANKP